MDFFPEELNGIKIEAQNMFAFIIIFFWLLSDEVNQNIIYFLLLSFFLFFLYNSQKMFL